MDVIRFQFNEHLDPVATAPGTDTKLGPVATAPGTDTKFGPVATAPGSDIVFKENAR